MDTLTNVEKDAVFYLLTRYGLSRQLVDDVLNSIKVVERDYTGAGVYITLKSDHTFDGRFRNALYGVSVFSDELPNGAAANLFFKDDRVDFLEFCAYDGEFPATLKNVTWKVEELGAEKD